METQLKTQLLGFVGNKFNTALLEKDINLIATAEGYVGFSNDTVGFFQILPLWNCHGDARDGKYSNYEGAAKLTELGKKLPHINEILNSTFDLQFLKFARIFELCDGAFLFPHRDYLELESGFTRLHIPLKTNENALNSNEMSVYHMRVGEIWLHDGRFIHSAINFSSESRLNLIIDFDTKIPIADLFKDKSAMILKNQPKIVERTSLTQEDEKSIYSLSTIINQYNLKEIVSILSKIHFHKQISPALTYDWLQSIALATGNHKIIQKSQEIKQHFIGKRKDYSELKNDSFEQTPSFQWFC